MKHFERALAMLLAIIMMVPAVAFAQEDTAVVEEVQAAYVDEFVEELPELSLGFEEDLVEEELPIEEETEIEELPAGEEIIIEGFLFPEDIPMPEVFLSAEGECGHMYNKMTFVTFGNGKLTDVKKYEKCDNDTHWAVGDVYRITQCFDCGEIVEKTLLAKNGRIKQRHTPNSKKVCTKCKAKISTKVTTEVKQVYVPYDDMYEPINDGVAAGHLWKGNFVERTYEHDPIYGTSYNTELDVILEADVEWRENHTFSGNICEDCGYVRDDACAHVNLEVRPVMDNWPYSAPGDEFQHHYMGDWYEDLFCVDCGTDIATDPLTGEEYPKWHFGDDVMQDHEFVNGVCDDCGHKAAFTLSAKSLKLGIGQPYTLTYAFENELGENKVTFKSSNSKIASVNKETGEIKAKKTGSVTITATAANGKKVACKVKVYKKPTSVKVDIGKKKYVGLYEGASRQMKVKLSSGSYSPITWSAEGPITVDQNGYVTALEGDYSSGSGVAYVTATTYNGKSASAKICVCETPIYCRTHIPDLNYGEGRRFDLGVGEKATMEIYNLIEDYCGDKPPVFSVYNTFGEEGDEPLAKIDPKTGKLTPLSPGDITVRLTLPNGYYDENTILIRPAPSKVTVTNAPKKMGVGEGYKLDVKLGADDEDCAGAYTFSSSNTKVATVGKHSGVIKAKKTGTTKITVTTYNKHKYTFTVKVYKKPTKAKLNATKLYLGLGESFDLNVKYPSGTYGNVTWDKGYYDNCITIDQNGVVTTKGIGTATVTATLYNKELTCEVYVGYEPEAVDFGLENMVLHVGQAQTIPAIPVSSKGDSYGKVTYQSSDTSIATVSSTGKVTPKKVGLVTITAQAYAGAPDSYELVVLPRIKSVKINLPSRIPAGYVIGFDPETGEYDNMGIFDYITVSPDATGVPGASVFAVTSIKSSNTKVADVGLIEEDGLPVLVTFKKGKFTLTVKTYNGKTAKKTITVY